MSIATTCRLRNRVVRFGYSLNPSSLGNVTISIDLILNPFDGSQVAQFFVGIIKRKPRNIRIVPDPVLILPAACFLPSSLDLPPENKPKIIRNMIVIKAEIKKHIVRLTQDIIKSQKRA